MTIALPPLPYALDALEPVIGARTLEFHHGKHHAGYVNKVLDQIRDTPLRDKSLEEIVHIASETGDAALFNNAAQAWNHAFYWQSLSPQVQQPGEVLTAMLERDFGGVDDALGALVEAAAGHFGSGWAWLVLESGKLEVITTANADTPLTKKGVTPLLTIDVWEHAYYLDYQSDRRSHVAAIVKTRLNWRVAQERLQAPAMDPSAIEGDSVNPRRQQHR